jgi:hypothetical protein
MKSIDFCDIAPCNLGVDRRFRGADGLYYQGDESFVYFESTRRGISDVCYFYIRRHENLKSHVIYMRYIFSLSLSVSPPPR